MKREPFFAPSLTLVRRSLLLNRTETLATHASFILAWLASLRCGCIEISVLDYREREREREERYARAPLFALFFHAGASRHRRFVPFFDYVEPRLVVLFTVCTVFFPYTFLLSQKLSMSNFSPFRFVLQQKALQWFRRLHNKCM